MFTYDLPNLDENDLRIQILRKFIWNNIQTVDQVDRFAEKFAVKNPNKLPIVGENLFRTFSIGYYKKGQEGCFILQSYDKSMKIVDLRTKLSLENLKFTIKKFTDTFEEIARELFKTKIGKNQEDLFDFLLRFPIMIHLKYFGELQMRYTGEDDRAADPFVTAFLLYTNCGYIITKFTPDEIFKYME